MQNQYIDLPINIQQTPKLLLEKAPQVKVSPKPQQAAHDLIKALETLIKGSAIDLYMFYETNMVAVYKTHFVDAQWPKPQDLQQLFDTQYKSGAQTIYRQFALRTHWQKLKRQGDVQKYCDTIDQAWEEYTSIFKLQWTRINFPAEMIWDYFDSFLQIYFYHRHKSNYIKQSSSFNPQHFNKEQCRAMLKNITSSMPVAYNPNCSSKQIFGYYALVTLVTIELSQQKYKDVLNHISRISLKDITILSKGLGSLLTVFYAAAFSYFMLQQYYKSVKVCEIVVLFYHKYRKFYDKSFSFLTQLQPIYEKLVVLQCINYIFLQQKPKTAVLQIWKNANIKTKQRQARDKISQSFFKLKQHDNSTFWRLFSFLCFQFSIPNIQKSVTQKFKRLQQININTIIQNYKRIEIQKIAKMLSISKEQVLNKFKSFGAVQKTESPWDSTIMNPLLKQKKKINVIVQGNVAIFDSQTVDSEESSRQWQRYREQISWLQQKVKTL